MKKMLPALLTLAIFTGCSKSDTTDTNFDFNTSKDAAISDFVNKVAMPAYAELKTKATTLNTAITNLNATTTDANLDIAKNAWKDMRVTWERSEGFLFGPVEDNNYDPETDTWPVDFNVLNDLLNSPNPLTVSDIDTLPLALRGYHPIEYILWGQGGSATAASITAREKVYMVSLSQTLQTKATQLYNDWDPAGGNYANKFLTAGEGSSLFVKKQDAFFAIVGGMVDICGEVGDGKMKEPFLVAGSDPAAGALLVESPFSGNSLIDFRNNIQGAYNVYLGKFNDDGTGLEDLVKARNSELDSRLQQQFNAAILSFNNITVPYEQAISTQRTQCQATMDAINTLAETIDTDLRNFVTVNITD